MPGCRVDGRGPGRLCLLVCGHGCGRGVGCQHRAAPLGTAWQPRSLLAPRGGSSSGHRSLPSLQLGRAITKPPPSCLIKKSPSRGGDGKARSRNQAARLRPSEKEKRQEEKRRELYSSGTVPTRPWRRASFESTDVEREGRSFSREFSLPCSVPSKSLRRRGQARCRSQHPGRGWRFACRGSLGREAALQTQRGGWLVPVP